MLLDASKTSALYRMLNSTAAEEIEKLRGADVTLTSALFLALSHRYAAKEDRQNGARHVGTLNLPGVVEATRCLGAGGEQKSLDPFGAPNVDFYRIDSKAALLSEEWVLFYDRFRRSAANRKKSDMYRGVSGVLGEMGDNVVSHAFEAEDRPCLALAGFHVTDGTAAFCVADFGQGFRSSLRRDERWTGLSSESEALAAVVHKNATSRYGETSGGGFKELFKSLLDFNGLVILRSGCCTYRLKNEGDIRRLTIQESSHVPGSSITVVISPRAQPEEKKL